MAAKRSGIHTVIIPKENQRDLAEIDPAVRDALRFITADTMDVVLREALLRPEPAVEREGEAVAAFIPLETAQRDAGLRQ